MKRSDFIKSLKYIKNRIEEKRKNRPKELELDTQAIDRLCNCRGIDGSIKNLYLSYKDASYKAEYLLENYNLILDIYECPTGYGWHLSRR